MGNERYIIDDYSNNLTILILILIIVVGTIIVIIVGMEFSNDCEKLKEKYNTCDKKIIECFDSCKDLNLDYYKYESQTLGSSSECWCNDKGEIRQIW